jgi:TonB-dependent receptor
VNLFNLDFKENDQIYKGDFKIPFTVGSDVSGFFKFGGEYRYNHRVNNQNLPYARIDRGSAIQNAISDSLVAHFGITYTQSNGRFNGTNFTYPTSPDLHEPFLEDRYGSLMWLPTTPILISIADYIAGQPSFNSIYSTGTNAGGWFNGAYEQYANYYKYIEKYYAGYLMTELSLGSDVKLVGGARYEQDKSLFEAFNMKDGRSPGTQIPYPVTVYPQNHYWLPMVQGKYDVTDWVDVRYSYTQTLARPDYTQLTPHFTMDFSRGNVWAGNPKLLPGRAYNHDVQFTFHTNDLGLLSIGAFYKTIKNFTYYTQYKLHAKPAPGLDSLGMYTVGGVSPIEGANLYTYINSPYEATVKGIEADFQTRFWYLPVPFNGLVFGINYTHIWSKATYPWRDDRTTTNPNPPPRLLVTTIDSTREGRLINQPSDIMNTYLGYDYEGFSGRVSFVFQGNSVSSIGIFENQDGFTRDYFRVDVSARQKLPVTGLQLFLDVTNLNSRRNESAQRSIGGFTSVQNYGVAANLGIRFTL